jgi:hypothetical protein
MEGRLAWRRPRCKSDFPQNGILPANSHAGFTRRGMGMAWQSEADALGMAYIPKRKPIAMFALRILPVAFCAALMAQPILGPAEAFAQTSSEARIGSLSDVLRMDDVIDIMRQEGITYGRQLQDELLEGRGGPTWERAVDLIYDRTTLRNRFDSVLETELANAPDAVAEIEQFFLSDLGQEILTLEIEARRSLLDEAVEDAARARVQDMASDGDPRLEALERFAEINDLTEANVSGALNSNLAFFQGLAEQGALRDEMTEDQMLRDVWAQEADIREETLQWLFPYLALAYGSLSDEELESYIQFSLSNAGQSLNNALFAAFDVVFASISRDLGRAAARQMMGDDI